MPSNSAVVPGSVISPGFPPMFTETLWGCFTNWHICCEELWCCYCHLGTLWDYLNTGTQTMDPLVCCGTLCCDLFLTVGIARCLVALSLRNQIFTFYNFDRQHEGNCTSCLIACFCTGCSMCQIHRELHARGNYPGGIACYTPPEPAPSGAPMGHKQEPQGVPFQQQGKPPQGMPPPQGYPQQYPPPQSNWQAQPPPQKPPLHDPLGMPPPMSMPPQPMPPQTYTTYSQPQPQPQWQQQPPPPPPPPVAQQPPAAAPPAAGPPVETRV